MEREPLPQQPQQQEHRRSPAPSGRRRRREGTLHRPLLPPLLLLVALLAAASTELVSSAATAEYNPTKCSACEAVASELRRRLDAESRTAPVDLRNRLGPSSGSGNRRGRVVEWRASEQRAVELLEGLCAAMSGSYRLYPPAGAEVEESARMWRKFKGEGRDEAVPPPPEADAAHEAESKALAAACGLLLEEVEEELVAALREDGGKDVEEEGGEEEEDQARPSGLDVSALLCRRLTRRCEGKEEEAAAAEDRGRDDGEL